ncbi:MAG: hypothetical protein HQL27_05510 [Candidatus Omnitrophica bacterium]|nr:hypothetical protein [Candidatus Omnitrophota bacterium]
MKRNYKRRLLLHINKFQKSMIWPILIACFVAAFMTFFCLEYYLASLTNTGIMILNYDVTAFEWAIPSLLLGVAGLLVFIIFWVFYLSNKVVGPFDRITRELDEVIVGQRKGPLTARKGDTMFEELLKRINTLLEKIK